MLSEKTLNQVKAQIDKINNKLKAEAEQELSSGKKIKEVLDHLVDRAVRKFTPESKRLMGSIYNVLSNETLQAEFFQNPAHQEAFYKRNIEKDIKDSFSFEVPDRIDYNSSENHIDTWISSVVVVGSGLVSIGIKNPAPIAIAGVLVALYYLFIKKLIEGDKQQDQTALIDAYLTAIKDTLVRWLENMADYYDKQVEALKLGLR